MLNKLGKLILEAVEVIGISVTIIAILHIFILQPNEVSGESMEPYLQNKDRILTDKLSYNFKEPERGEIVIFKYPPNPKEEFIKRIVALPNEQIEIKNNQVIVYNNENPSGFVLNENYLGSTVTTEGRTFIKEGEVIDVPSDSYVVFGDNRPYSSDSRNWGFITKEDIVGRALLRIWPANTLKVIIK